MRGRSDAERGGIALEERAEQGEYRSSGEAASAPQNAFPTLQREGETQALRICEGCGVEFLPQRRHQKFHSPKCRKESWEKKKRRPLGELEASPPLLRAYLKALGKALCGFCERLVEVDVERGGEQRVRCRCGARWFRRHRRGVLECGWKRGKREILYSI